jgi:hypothetical protein
LSVLSWRGEIAPRRPRDGKSRAIAWAYVATRARRGVSQRLDEHVRVGTSKGGDNGEAVQLGTEQLVCINAVVDSGHSLEVVMARCARGQGGLRWHTRRWHSTTATAAGTEDCYGEQCRRGRGDLGEKSLTGGAAQMEGWLTSGTAHVTGPTWLQREREGTGVGRLRAADWADAVNSTHEEESPFLFPIFFNYSGVKINLGK